MSENKVRFLVTFVAVIFGTILARYISAGWFEHEPKPIVVNVNHRWVQVDSDTDSDAFEDMGEDE